MLMMLVNCLIIALIMAEEPSGIEGGIALELTEAI